MAGSDSIPEFSQRVPPHAGRIGSGKSDVVELTPAHHPEIDRRLPRLPPLFDPGMQPPDCGMDASNPHLDDDWEPVQRRRGAVLGVIRVHRSALRKSWTCAWTLQAGVYRARMAGQFHQQGNPVSFVSHHVHGTNETRIAGR
jgi:hypothetical protein